MLYNMFFVFIVNFFMFFIKNRRVNVSIFIKTVHFDEI